VLFLCENNLYAMGTAIWRSQSRIEVAEKASGYGIAGHIVDGMDVVAVEAATREAAQKVRAGEGPQFLELRTYRFRAHSMYDPELYRTKSEVEEWKRRDPIVLLTARLRAMLALADVDLDRIEREVEAEIAAAVAFAESSPFEPTADLLRDVHTGAGA
jgi:TPP-dependent pyruvate/acetoin dehydrogenase alpha subunit